MFSADKIMKKKRTDKGNSLIVRSELGGGGGGGAPAGGGAGAGRAGEGRRGRRGRREGGSKKNEKYNI